MKGEMKYLVVGGAGFIGSHLAERLISYGEKVRILDNFSSGKRENIKGLPVEVIKGDIRNKNDIKRAVHDIDIVFHLADLCSSKISMDQLLKINVTGTRNVLHASMEEGVRRVVISSSSEVYGPSKVIPKHEYMETRPYSSYGITKLFSEFYSQAYDDVNLETVILRYFNVFGPRQNPASGYPYNLSRLINRLLKGSKLQIVGPGSQTCDFTYVENIVQANILAASSALAAGKIINVAEGNSISELELLKELKENLKIDLTPNFISTESYKEHHSRASILRAQELLGYSPTINFKVGMKRTVQWYLNYKSKQEVSVKQKRRPRTVSAPALVSSASVSPAPASDLVNDISFSQRFKFHRYIPLQIQRWLKRANC